MSYCALTESSYDFSLQILIFFGFRSGDFDGTFMMLLLPRFFASSVPASWFVVKLALAFELSATTKQHWRNCSHSGGNLAATFVMVATSVCQWLVIKED